MKKKEVGITPTYDCLLEMTMSLEITIRGFI
jgi:hypothetical protein